MYASQFAFDWFDKSTERWAPPVDNLCTTFYDSYKKPRKDL
jgi:hypothetical protein